MLAKDSHYILVLLVAVFFAGFSSVINANTLNSDDLNNSFAERDPLAVGTSLAVRNARVIVSDETDPIPSPLTATDTRIRLATGQGYYPFVSASLPQGGWSQALITQTFHQMGYEVDIHILPWSRGKMWTDEHRFLGTFPYVRSPKREQEYYFSVPINYIPVRFYVSRASNITDIQELSGKRLCLPYGYSDKFASGGIVDRLNLKINRVVDGAGCIGHVQRGWSDAGLTNSYVSLNEVTNTRLIDDKLLVLPTEVEQVSVHFIISKSYPNGREWMDNFNQAVQQLSKDGTKAKIDHIFSQIINSPSS
ncbi:transporter substrate-binding domain-containing protein [Paraglaciecola chathamensis]|uniref:substrate-binding periplasmic protein n=1 Tax=Paraglaciecola chathamensis TaxID=368405 RepID=UPI0027117DE0|nr:transporter substrate-binding domain-containing protein [Paraglaciecola chathamensis]MDO6837977.1 transporter substrate-binding domain-containing protein [Paraglaciecola chathamensis]